MRGLVIVSRAPGDQARRPLRPTEAIGSLRGPTAGPADDDIYASLVSSSGVPITRAGHPISTAFRDQRAPAVAWNGTRYLVVWEDQRGAAALTGTASGANFALTGCANRRPSGEFSSPDGAEKGKEAVLVRSCSPSASGPLGPRPRLSARPLGRRNGTGMRAVSGAGADIYGTRVSGTNSVQDPSGIPISTATSDQTNRSPPRMARASWLSGRIAAPVPTLTPMPPA